MLINAAPPQPRRPLVFAVLTMYERPTFGQISVSMGSPAI
jgi:hypothetical protein